MQIFSLMDQFFLIDSSIADKMQNWNETQWFWWSMMPRLQYRPEARMSSEECGRTFHIFLKEFRIKILENLYCLEAKQTTTFATLHMKNRKGKSVQMTETLWAGLNIVLFQNGWVACLLCSSRIIRSVSQLVPRRVPGKHFRKSCEKAKGCCS